MRGIFLLLRTLESTLTKCTRELRPGWSAWLTLGVELSRVPVFSFLYPLCILCILFSILFCND
jgi:hypothetical protein